MLNVVGLAEEATHIDDKACKTMDNLRAAADGIEDMCTVEEWSLPTYEDLLFIQCSETTIKNSL